MRFTTRFVSPYANTSLIWPRHPAFLKPSPGADLKATYGFTDSAIAIAIPQSFSASVSFLRGDTMIFFTRLQTDFGFFSLLSSCCLFPGAEEPASEEAALTDLRTPWSFVSQGKKKLEGRTCPRNQSNEAQTFKKGGGPRLGRQAALPAGSGCLPSAQGSSKEAFTELSPVPPRLRSK